jgi:hypothetical protein
MSSFTPIDYSSSFKEASNLIMEYGRNGDIDLIKTVDFRLFCKASIQEFYKDLKKSATKEDAKEDALYPDKIDECIEYVKSQYEADLVWDTPKYIIHAVCYCDRVHKVQNKETGKYFAVYCKEVAQKLNLSNEHFKKTK